MKQPYELTAIFRQAGPLHVSSMLSALDAIRQELKSCSPLLNEWLLKGNTKNEAYRYEAFDAAGPTTAAIAVLTASLKADTGPKIIGIWNGKEGSEGASLQYIGRSSPESSLIVLRAKPDAFSNSAEPVIRLLSRIVELFEPAAISLETYNYYDKKVFKDRPGVGWMLYLPQILTANQVPEAGALVPVMGKSENSKSQQVGTIIISVMDEPFSDENPEHVNIANAIEIRLVDQDLLPRSTDL